MRETAEAPAKKTERRSGCLPVPVRTQTGNPTLQKTACSGRWRDDLRVIRVGFAGASAGTAGVNSLGGVLAAAAVLFLAAGGAARGEGVISIQFRGTRVLASNDVAGVVAVSNWTSLGANTLTNNLVDDDGSPTTADLTTTCTSPYNTNNDQSLIGSDATGKMLSGFVGYFNPGTDWFVLEQIPYPVYDIYLYWGSGRDNDSKVYGQTYILYDGTDTEIATGGLAFQANFVWDANLTRSLATNHTDAAANYLNCEYLRFEGLTTSTLKINLPAGGIQPQRQGLSGLQLVGNPSAPAGTVVLIR